MKKSENKYYHCIKTLKGEFGTFHAGKIYSNIDTLASNKLVYVHYFEEDMIDYGVNGSKLMKIVPGLKFSLQKDFHFKYFYEYFSDVKNVRKEKLKKIAENENDARGNN